MQIYENQYKHSQKNGKKSRPKCHTLVALSLNVHNMLSFGHQESKTTNVIEYWPSKYGSLCDKILDPFGVLAFPHRLTRGEKAVGLYNKVGTPHEDLVALYTLFTIDRIFINGHGLDNKIGPLHDDLYVLIYYGGLYFHKRPLNHTTRFF